MVTQTAKYASTFRRQTTESSSSTVSRQVHIHQEVRADPVSGGWITFPDSSKFRKPTTYYRGSYGLILESPQVTRSSPKFNRRWVDTGLGGWNPDILMGALCPSIPGLVSGKLYTPVATPPAMANEAVTKALNKIADQKANIGENLATFKQVSGLIKGPGEALLSSLKSVWSNRSLRPFLNKTIRDIRREGIDSLAARKYIEYVYGWKPLMSDIYGIMEMAKESGSRPLLLSGRGTAQRNASGSGYVTAVSEHTVTEWTTHEEVRTTCKLYGRIDPEYAGLRALNQLGLLNPASLAWDLVKWSFVVDWFVPIGPVLNALTAPAGLTFVAGTTSSRLRSFGSYKNNWDSWDIYIGTSAPATGKTFSNAYVRNVHTTWPLPGFFVSHDPFSGDRPLKALALGIMNLRSLR